ncbi:mycofactocin biosynthesis peptidyl-dipeptidase MftE [Mycolicibacterium moriokaense]|nr:mycofactocin biosynthesis peptidyl-dipeptidase MftE [Mycolicibacterium moriokaense]
MNSSYHRRVAFPSELGNSTSRQLHGTSPALVIPVGSTEQHGPHLPLDTDTRIAGAVAQGVAEQLAEVDHESGWMVAPPIGYGASGEHASFPGTVSIGTSALRLLLVEFGRSAASWARRLVFVNGHGGNTEALAAATALLRYEGRDVGWCSCAVKGADAHAGHTETSVLLHISPDVVRREEVVPGNRAPLGELLPAMRSGGVAAVSELGVLGDPTTATAIDGERLFAEMVDGCVRRITRWQPDRDGMLT